MPDAKDREATRPERASLPAAPWSVWTTREPGTYLLLLYLGEAAAGDVGRLGRVTFSPGWYVYVGSALGGLGARLRRHARSSKVRHWHVDALREVAQLVEVVTSVGRERRECAVASQITALPGVTRPIARFGASDCHCRAHLFHFVERPDLQLDATWSVTPVVPANERAPRRR